MKECDVDVGTVGSDGIDANDSDDVYTHFYEHSMLTFARVSISDKMDFILFCICYAKVYSLICILS